jgi:SAM-dependent methyltransferase
MKDSKLKDLLLKIYKVMNLLYTLNSLVTFRFNNQSYHYFYSDYNQTWKNERAVEIPIIHDILNKNRNKRVVEFGNVLSYYFSINHDVLDKYEKIGNVINEDVIKFKPKTKYDLILSISTIEHVGWDEKVGEVKLDDSKKILLAISNLKRILSKNGEIVITFPLGFNPHLDYLIKNNKIEFDKLFFMKRISFFNRWAQANWDEVKDIGFSFGFPYTAKAIGIGIIKK